MEFICSGFFSSLIIPCVEADRLMPKCASDLDNMNVNAYSQVSLYKDLVTLL